MASKDQTERNRLYTLEQYLRESFHLLDIGRPRGEVMARLSEGIVWINKEHDNDCVNAATDIGIAYPGMREPEAVYGSDGELILTAR
jgi:hypothetical protein